MAGFAASLRNPKLFAVVRRNPLMKFLAKRVHLASLTPHESQSPVTRELVTSLKESLSCPHWLRDDVDYIRPILDEILLQKVHQMGFEAKLGACVLMQESNIEGDRVVEAVFVLLQHPPSFQLHVVADGNGRVPYPRSVSLFKNGEGTQLLGYGTPVFVISADGDGPMIYNPVEMKTSGIGSEERLKEMLIELSAEERQELLRSLPEAERKALEQSMQP
mmetsp:Transcript_65/g.100  ORF Transcript_65/g.100 Transcript_65/m.100 type:complete len:219 (-) Transcript_65:159-815(-)|eukprot:CAMPEP_0184320732 /NCGR_PEP_ID=MMETSP1049-20130417/115504_1 /TAXON_ID=77928 /ORGANISM="Proteomonas sulcata, Strain CCMP704" /LENGTH=218 /DNA_ID=CAMNT_0026641319 /DNA_START=204 /DNA_END=860 /DNA_ORIENTATION=-